MYEADRRQAQVHFTTQSSRAASVPISEVLSRLHIEINGRFAMIRGRRTSFHSLVGKGFSHVYLPDGTPFCRMQFRAQHARRPPRAASTRLMQASDWLGCLLVCTPSTESLCKPCGAPGDQPSDERSSAAAGPAASLPPSKYGPCRYGASCRQKLDPEHCAKYSHPVAAKYGPCKYGASCRDKHDPGHCAKYSHPEGSATTSVTCATPGCDRAPSGGYRTCCAQCRASEGATHSSSCYEVAPIAVLVVEDVTIDADDWVLNLRSLSEKAAAASSRLCRYNCGMRTSEVDGKSFDTCCRQCASWPPGRHDARCAGRAPDALLADFKECVDLDSLVPPTQERGTRGTTGVAGSASSERRHAKGPSKECGICFGDEGIMPAMCNSSHSFCKDCMRRHIEEELEGKGVLPACPLSSECSHLLTRDQVEDITVSSAKEVAIMRRFDLLSQRLGLQALGAFPCARETCPDWIVPSRPGKQQLVECPACKIRFCSLCKRKPYHWRITSCEDAPRVDQAWHQWLGEERDAYLEKLAARDPEYIKILEQLGSKKAEQFRMLEAAEARRREFAEMERWKAANCKCCPKCSRVINKVDGCDSMVCGRNYHGGDVQNGCGASFRWSSAPAYTAQEAVHIPKAAVKDFDESPKGYRMFWECEAGVYLRCAMCKFAIRGPLFLCVDCLACCACLRCANGMGSAAGGQHLPESHAFSILWKLDDLKPFDLAILKEHHLTTRCRKTRPGEELSPEEHLLEMGYSQHQVSQALAASAGDLAAAAAYLTREG